MTAIQLNEAPVAEVSDVEKRTMTSPPSVELSSTAIDSSANLAPSWTMNLLTLSNPILLIGTKK